MPKSKKTNKVKKPTDRANLSQNLDKRAAIAKDMNGRHGIDPK